MSLQSKLIALSVLLLSFSSFAINQCGTDPVEKKYPQVVWEEAAEININSSMMDMVGLLCIGRNKTNLTQIERITYRDHMNHVVEANQAQLLKGIILLRSTDMPSDFSFALRGGSFVSLKLVKETKDATTKTTHYNMNMRFLRNVSIGFSANDYREFSMNGVINWQNNQMQVEYNNKRFDLVVFNLSTFPANIEEIIFSDLNKMLFKVYPLNLKMVSTLL